MNIITQKYEGITNGIISPVMVCQSKYFCKQNNLLCFEKLVDALWDTGAGISCISKSLVEELKIQPILNEADFKESKGAGGSYLSRNYLIDLLLMPDYQISNLKVSDFVDNGKFHFLIGMDIITLGDFAITNHNDLTVFSFRIPSSEAIDFKKNK